MGDWLDELEGLLGKATPGDWDATSSGYLAKDIHPSMPDALMWEVGVAGRDWPPIAFTASEDRVVYDACLIAELRNHARELIDAAKDSLEAECTRTEKGYAVRVWRGHDRDRPEILHRCDPAEADKLRAALREAYEAWAGSELGFQAETAPEAYCLRVIEQMLEPIRGALK